ncbi:MarR family transcriptional regulator [bacterium]|nr:MarR family transcriptional regulator [bacterium]
MTHYVDSLYYEIELTGKYFRFLGTQMFNELKMDVSVDEFLVLDIIKTNDKICQRDIAKLLLKDRANTGRIINSLEKKELLTRSVDTKNNRLVKQMKLTEKGEKILETSSEYIKDGYRKISEQITQEEIGKIKETLRNFREIMKTIAKPEI